MDDPAQLYGCTFALGTPEAFAIARRRAVSTPPALNESAPQVRPGIASVAVTVVASTGATGRT